MDLTTVLRKGRSILEKVGEGLDTIARAATEIYDIVKTEMEARQSERAAVEARSVSRALHILQDVTPPRIALVGETSSGKSSLVNALFGDAVNRVSRTPDTTDCIIEVRFSSGLVIYDTPGLGSNETYENTTRLFLGMPPDPDLPTISRIPFRAYDDNGVQQLTSDEARRLAQLDVVLFVMNVSRTLTRRDKPAYMAAILQLRQVYRTHLVVAGTHYDVLLSEPPEDRDRLLASFQNIASDQLIPVSSTMGEGLSDLVTRLFRALPTGVSLAALQQALLRSRKSSRLQFVISESSIILADIAILDGSKADDAELLVLVLFSVVCQHFSVDGAKWQELSGNIGAINTYIKTHGITGKQQERSAVGFWENVKSLFGKRFYETVKEYHLFGAAALSDLLPALGALIVSFAELKQTAIEDTARRWVLDNASRIDNLARIQSTDELAAFLADALSDWLEGDSRP